MPPVESPSAQTFILGLVLMFCVGLNNAVLGLGAGGSRPENIPTVDRVSYVLAFTIVGASFLGGPITNKLGPRYTVVLASLGYPLFIGCLWSLDRGGGTVFPYIAAVFHGAGSALMYSATGFITSSYSVEHTRGKYMVAPWVFISLGSSLAAVIVLTLTITDPTKRSSVPDSVYATIIVMQSIGTSVALLLKTPSQVRRADNRAIASFEERSWKTELVTLKRSFTDKRVWFLSLGLFSSQVFTPLFMTLNAFYFDASARALANISCGGGFAFAGYLSDLRYLGRRRRRALFVAIITAIFLIVAYGAILGFIGTHNLVRKNGPRRVDLASSSQFVGPLLIFMLFGFAGSTFQAYAQWTMASYSNNPTFLAHLSGLMEALKASGVAVVFVIDSHGAAFILEGSIYFGLTICGLLLAGFGSALCLRDTEYGREENVIVPEDFEQKPELFVKAQIRVIIDGAELGTADTAAYNKYRNNDSLGNGCAQHMGGKMIEVKRGFEVS